MKRQMLALLAPPIAVCHYGCAGCCAAPIGVMWMAGMIGIIYGYGGGPTAMESISWVTVGLGFMLWAIAVIWAMTVARGVDDPKCQQKQNTVNNIDKKDDDNDPMADINKLTH